MYLENYPFVKELIVDTSGKVRSVAIDLADYQKLLEILEDEGLYRAMAEVKDETPISLEAALQALEQDEN
jgi:hypothetical protein